MVPFGVRGSGREASTNMSVCLARRECVDEVWFARSIYDLWIDPKLVYRDA